LDNDTLIEATGLTNRVRKVSSTERLGKPLDRWMAGDKAGSHTLLFGTYLPGN
jgi:hypothetical protein